jgi:protein TonB
MMSYAGHKVRSHRVVALTLVAVIHAVLGYALLTGLSYKIVKQVAAELKTFDIEEPPPPPEEPPPPQDVPESPPPIVAPPPLIRTSTPPPIVQTVSEASPAIVTLTAPSVPPAPPAPATPQLVEPAKARADLASLFSADDYPSSAIYAEEQGVTVFRLNVGANGRVTGCTVIKSSGSDALDATTCRVLVRRARFIPARDNRDQATTDTHTGRIRWALPDN